MTNSTLLSSLGGISHGFLSSYQPGGRDALDAAEPGIATVKQVHGAALLWTDRVEKRAREADALATSLPGLPVGVYSADCTPLLLAAFAGQHPVAVMAVHAGWRGTAAGIARLSFEHFSREAREAGAEKFFAAVGPCISPESFEVGEEVVHAFPGSLERGQARFLRTEGEKKKYLFDLPGENIRQLKEAASRSGQDLELDWLRLCTFQLKESFPSYRRDRERAGRILSFIAFER